MDSLNNRIEKKSPLIVIFISNFILKLYITNRGDNIYTSYFKKPRIKKR